MRARFASKPKNLTTLGGSTYFCNSYDSGVEVASASAVVRLKSPASANESGAKLCHLTPYHSTVEVFCFFKTVEIFFIEVWAQTTTTTFAFAAKVFCFKG